MRPSWQRFRRLAYLLIGIGAPLLSLVYLSWIAVENFSGLKEIEFGWELTLGTVSGSALYAASLMLMATAWGWLLRSAGVEGVKWQRSVIVYGRANISKYLPSNILHYAARQFLARDEGWPQLPVASASILETAMLVVVAVMIAMSGWGISDNIRGLWPLEAGVMVLIAVAAAWSVAAVSLSISPLRKWERAPTIKRMLFSKQLVYCLCIHVAVFAIWVAILAIAAYALGLQWSQMDLAIMAVALAASWVASVFTPLVPGGIGIREAGLVLFLAPLMGEAMALTVTLVFRVQTMTGEVLLFVLSIARKSHQQRFTDT